MKQNLINLKTLRATAVALSASLCLVSSTSIASFSKEKNEQSSTSSDTNSGVTATDASLPGEPKVGETKSSEPDKNETKTGDPVSTETKTDSPNPLDASETPKDTGVTGGADTSEATPAATSATPQTKPNEPPPPTEEQLKKRNEAFGKAAQFMAKKKYDEAIKAFDSAWKSGGDSGEALIYMGSCYYSKKQYPQALKQYQLASVKGTNFKTRHKAEGMAARLASYMRGVCPDTCLKASTPGWQHRDAAGHPSKELWMHFRYSDSKGSGTVAYSQNHIGEKIGRVNGVPKSIGKCPTCGGTGRVSLP